LEWRGKDDPKEKGFVSLSTLRRCQNEDEYKIVLLDHNLTKKLILEAESTEQKEEWTKALKSILADSSEKNKAAKEEEELNSEIAQSQQNFAMKQQRMKRDMDKRQNDAEKKKKKFGNIGMKHTAEAMMRGTPAAATA
jgi:hypothetical protein